jgi:hypothetical protein
MKPLVPCLLALAAGSAAIPAAAQTTTLWHSGPIGRWAVTAARDSAGSNFCYMSNISGGSGMGYAVLANGSMRMVLMHNDWNIPPGARARITMRIDHYPTWTMTAQRAVDSASSVTVNARFDDPAVRFLNEIRLGNWLYIVFPNGQSYQVSLEGSNAAVTQLYYCNRNYVFGSTRGPNPLQD